jgi:hypothetical protein
MAKSNILPFPNRWTAELPWTEPPEVTLVYCVSACHGGVFSARGNALYVSAIHHALGAQTWGELRRRLPEGEWGTILDMLVNNYCYEDEETFPWDVDDAPFSMDQIPGVGEGDYPPWLQPEMDAVLPRDLLSRYAKRESFILNGPFWSISEENVKPVVDALRARGVVVERGDDLDFY